MGRHERPNMTLNSTSMDSIVLFTSTYHLPFKTMPLQRSGLDYCNSILVLVLVSLVTLVTREMLLLCANIRRAIFHSPNSETWEAGGLGRWFHLSDCVSGWGVQGACNSQGLWFQQPCYLYSHHVWKFLSHTEFNITDVF